MATDTQLFDAVSKLLDTCRLIDARSAKKLTTLLTSHRQAIHDAVSVLQGADTAALVAAAARLSSGAAIKVTADSTRETADTSKTVD